MVTMIFKANLITDPVQVENRNGNSSMHVASWCKGSGKGSK